MGILTRFADTLKSYPLPVRTSYVTTPLQPVGNDIILYPSDSGINYLTKGYNLNDAVYAIVSKNAEKMGQVRMYHAKVKKDERKTLSEYNYITKGNIGKRELKEMKRMRKSMIEDLEVSSPLSYLLNKPNRYQTQGEFVEQMFGYKELQGEGNVWLNSFRDANGKRTGTPVEMFIIPKQHLNLRTAGGDPWGILGYEFVLNNGSTKVKWDKEEVLMWKYANYNFDATTLEHLRGFSPLQTAMVLIQSMNEGDERLAISNKHGGAAGLAYREDVTQIPSLEQTQQIRRQFNEIVNTDDMAGKIAVMAGKWGYHNLAVSLVDQEILKQYDYGFERLCRVFKTPYGIFDSKSTYDNQKQHVRQWIYSKIAPNIYNLRALLSDALLPAFKLDPETNIIDCDINSLPELAEDLKDQVDAVKEAWWLTPNQRLSATGYEESIDPNMDKVYAPSGLSTLDDMNMQMNDNLDNEVNLLE